MKKITGYRNFGKKARRSEIGEKKKHSNITERFSRKLHCESVARRLKYASAACVSQAYVSRLTKKEKARVMQRERMRKEAFLSIVNKMSYSEILHICCFMGIKTEAEKREIMRLIKEKTENERKAMNIYVCEDNETKIMLREYAQKRLMEEISKP